MSNERGSIPKQLKEKFSIRVTFPTNQVIGAILSVSEESHLLIKAAEGTM